MFEIHFINTFEIILNRESFVYRMMESGPCYLKIYGNNTNKMRLDGNSIDLDSTKLSLDRLKSVYQVLRCDFFRSFSFLFAHLTIAFELMFKIGRHQASNCVAIQPKELEYTKCDANPRKSQST